ncbi:hypothetical protein NUW54_g5908 [Trametes sanguinea]|uniref:Uncharacterized protein n=1 Tax=Trametes sanguinea TaxID=158606 RepID=A0ACC1PTU7_9APHY|nr:hypothetical protein NUW54_g5908 [Trametes sanguinea]
MTVLSPPSARLPPIRRIHEHSVDILESLLKYLRAIYNPPVRGTRRVDRKARGTASKGGEDEDALVALRTDDFERAYTIRWLTGLVAQASLIQDEDAEDDWADQVFDEKIDSLIRDAASLLAVCAGTAAASTVTRRFSFAAPLLKSSVEVQLTDIPISVDGNAATMYSSTSYPGTGQLNPAYDERRGSWASQGAMHPALQPDAHRSLPEGGSDGSPTATSSWSPTGSPIHSHSLASAPPVPFSTAANLPAGRGRDHFRTRSYPSMQWQYDQASALPQSSHGSHHPLPAYAIERGGQAANLEHYQRYNGGDGGHPGR